MAHFLTILEFPGRDWNIQQFSYKEDSVRSAYHFRIPWKGLKQDAITDVGDVFLLSYHFRIPWKGLKHK